MNEELALTANPASRRPYAPHFIHAFYNWLGRLPLPDWLVIVLLILTVGFIQDLVAWRKGLLSQGQFDFDLGTAGFYLGIYLIGIYVLKVAPRTLDGYRPLLKVSDGEYENLKYRFATIPSLWGNLFFLAGLALGAINGLSDMAGAPAVDYAFPQMRIAVWMLGTAGPFLFGFQVIRQLLYIRAFYDKTERIDLFNLRPLFGFSRYTAAVGIMFFISFALTRFNPTEYESRVVLSATIVMTPLVLVLFFLPVADVHERLAAEKERLLRELNARIATMLNRIHAVAFEQQDYKNLADLRMVLSTLREERETVERVSTWPWPRSTLVALLTTLLLPLLIAVLRDLILRVLMN